MKNFTSSVKAIVIGVFFIAASLIAFQLLYLVLAPLYNNLGRSYPYLIEISAYLKALIILPTLLAIMFLGGYLTAVINHRKIILHTFIVGLLVAGMLWWLGLGDSKIASYGLIINALMLLSAVAGGYLRKRKLRSFDDYEDVVAHSS